MKKNNREPLPRLIPDIECRVFDLDGSRGAQGRIPQMKEGRFRFWANRRFMSGTHLRLTLFDAETFQVLHLYARVLGPTVTSALFGGPFRKWLHERMNLTGERVYEYRCRLVSWVRVPQADPEPRQVLAPPAFRDALAKNAKPRRMFGREGLFTRCRIAQGIDDNLAAWRLTYEELVGRNCALPNRHGVYTTKFHLVPATVTYLGARRDGTVLSALCGAGDSPLGLPADEYFGDFLGRIRHPERRFVELSLFAVKRDADSKIRREAQAALSSVFGFAVRHAIRVLKATDLFIVGDPQEKDFYRRHGFDLVEARRSSDGAREAGLYHLSLRKLDRLKNSWRRERAEENAFEAPRTLGPRELYELFIRKSDVTANLTNYEKEVLSEFYPHLADWFANLDTILQYC